MRFRGFHIEGFGLYHDAGMTSLPSLAVFTGANESGKTTLLEFFRFLLFGDRPGSAGAAVYPPLAGGRRGGRLLLETAAGEQLALERFGAGRTAAAALTDSAGTPVSNAEERLAALLGGLDRDAYERIFALGAAELQGLGLLDDQALVRRLAAAAAGTPALPAALARLDREIGSLLKGDRARKPRLNAAFSALDDALARQRAASGIGERYLAARDRLEARRGAARERQVDVERERRDLETASRVQPLFDRWARLRERRADSALEPRPTPVGAIVGLAAAGLALALAIGAAAGRWGLAVAILGTGFAGAALRFVSHRRAEVRRAADRDPLDREIEATRHELEAAAGTVDPVAYAEDLARRRACIRELEDVERALQREIGSLEREADVLGRGNELEVALADRAAARTELDRSLGEWARRALCRELLEEARWRHEAQRRPRVLAAAERHLALLLGVEPGRVGLVGDDSLSLRDAYGAQRREGQWSSGLADQVYLAVRLAFAQELAGAEGDGPPLVLDDVHLRFDAARRRGLARVLAGLARGGRQVLVFSCQTELESDLRAELAGSEVAGFFRLDRSRITREG